MTVRMLMISTPAPKEPVANINPDVQPSRTSALFLVSELNHWHAQRFAQISDILRLRQNTSTLSVSSHNERASLICSSASWSNSSVSRIRTLYLVRSLCPTNRINRGSVRHIDSLYLSSIVGGNVAVR